MSILFGFGKTPGWFALAGVPILYLGAFAAKMKYPSDDSKNMAPGGLQSFRPTLLVAVPKIWDILKKGVEDGLSKKPGIIRSFVQFGFSWRAYMIDCGVDSLVFRALFQKLFSPILGGRSRIFATGGGPIASEVQTFIRTLFCVPRGWSVSAGYLKRPEKTKAEFDENGFFHTGDIAIVLPDGTLKIVDRLKNLVKLKGGEYIAIEAMEKEYSESIFVNGINGGIMCYGDGSMDRPVALVQANVPPIKNWARENGIDVSDIEAVLRNDAVCKMVLNDLNREGKNGNLSRNEKLVAVGLISGNGSKEEFEMNSPWTPENGGLTASNKLQRKPIMLNMKEITDVLIDKGIKK